MADQLRMFEERDNCHVAPCTLAALHKIRSTWACACEPAWMMHDSSANGRKLLSKEDVSVILSSYDHNPKEQNPLYVTESNEFGRRKPSVATWTKKNHGVAQGFSKSFNNYVYRDEGLNF